MNILLSCPMIQNIHSLLYIIKGNNFQSKFYEIFHESERRILWSIQFGKNWIK